MFKKVVFMVAVMAFALAASAGTIVVHIDEDFTACNYMSVKVFTGNNTLMWDTEQTGTWLPGGSVTFNNVDLYGAYKIVAYGKNDITKMSDTDELTWPDETWPNHLYLQIPAGVQPPVDPPNNQD